MYNVIGSTISLIIIAMSQPFMPDNGGNSLLVVSNHCSCACCKEKNCTCGMDKTRTAGPMSSTPEIPCCGNSIPAPSPEGVAVPAYSFSTSNESQKNVGSSNPVLFFTDPRSDLHTIKACLSFSPPGLSPVFPLRI
jgi:hypothetical protein